MREVRIAQGYEFEFHVLLGRGEFLFELGHVLLAGAFQQARGVAVHFLARAEGLAVAREVRRHALHLAEFARLHDEEAIGNEEAEFDGEVGTVQRHLRGGIALELENRQRREGFERFEDFRDGRGGEFIHREFFADVGIVEQIRRDGGLAFLLLGMEGKREKRRTQHGCHQRTNRSHGINAGIAARGAQRANGGGNHQSPFFKSSIEVPLRGKGVKGDLPCPTRLRNGLIIRDP